MSEKKLVITGSGIKSLAHLTEESKAAICQAEIVLYLVNETITSSWIENNAIKCESLETIYFSETFRRDSYKKIVDRILNCLTQFERVCVVVYGHPMLLSNSIEHLINKIDRKKVEVTILPGISSFDCLIADLEIDPYNGCLSIEASELINKSKVLDPTNHLIIWQVGIIGDEFSKHDPGHSCIDPLKVKLLETYELDHQCIFYEASLYPHIPSKKINSLISRMDQIPISRLTTLYVPPV